LTARIKKERGDMEKGITAKITRVTNGVKTVAVLAVVGIVAAALVAGIFMRLVWRDLATPLGPWPAGTRFFILPLNREHAFRLVTQGSVVLVFEPRNGGLWPRRVIRREDDVLVLETPRGRGEASGGTVRFDLAEDWDRVRHIGVLAWVPKEYAGRFGQGWFGDRLVKTPVAWPEPKKENDKEVSR